MSLLALVLGVCVGVWEASPWPLAAARRRRILASLSRSSPRLGGLELESLMRVTEAMALRTSRFCSACRVDPERAGRRRLASEPTDDPTLLLVSLRQLEPLLVVAQSRMVPVLGP